MTTVVPEETGTGAHRIIEGDVDPSTGNVDCPGDIAIHGGVTAAHAVRGGRDVTIAGSVDNAEVRAGGNLAIGGGVIGQGKSICVAGGDLGVRHVNGATLEAAGNLVVQTNAVMARIICGGRLCVGGNINGGHVTANGGAQFRTAGSAAGTPAIVEIGIDESLRRLAQKVAAKLEADIEHLARRRASIAPLVGNLKGLVAREREKVTEMLYEIQELQEQVDASLAELRARQEQSHRLSRFEIVVDEVIYSGVTVRIGALESQIQVAIKGPITLTPRRVAGATAIVVVEPGSDACHALNTAPFHDDALARLNALLINKG